MSYLVRRLSGSRGAGKVGVSSASDYADGTLGFLVVKNTSNGYNALRGFSKAEQALIQAGTSVSDHAATLDAMLASEKHLYLPRGTFRRSTKWSITDRQVLEGAGSFAILHTTANVVGIETTGEEVHLEGFKMTFAAGHAANGINVGTVAGDRSDRPDIRRVHVSGAGADGIRIYAGNLGTLGSMRVRSSAGFGVVFDSSVSADNNVWTIDGFLDVSNNGIDGFALYDGTGSLSDPYASRKHRGGMIVAQANGRYGVFVGTSGNLLEVYAENNVTGQIYVSDKGFGNRIESAEGLFTGPGVNANGNRCITHSANADGVRAEASKFQLKGGSGFGWRIRDNDGTAGYLDVEKTAAREIRFKHGGSAGVWNVYNEHSTPGTEVATRFEGRLSPIGDRLWSIGEAALRWLMVHTDAVRLWGAATGVAGATTLGNGTATTVGAAGAAAALPAQPLGYLVAYVGTTPVKIPYYSN